MWLDVDLNKNGEDYMGHGCIAYITDTEICVLSGYDGTTRVTHSRHSHSEWLALQTTNWKDVMLAWALPQVVQEKYFTDSDTAFVRNVRYVVVAA